MATIEELMSANLLEVFNERDGERRRAAIRRTYAPDVQFSDPDEIVVGHDALDAKAQNILDRAPGFVFTPAGAVYVNHDLGYLTWNFGPAGQPPVVRGVDIALVRDGLIRSVYTLLLTD
ncbi:nuclear transport factor 2 family protein [Cryptosporangium arvum]|uniref:nuclear transport factor 2 family protein n=1 Tax=Cryptosporangium arvum TaxID=80871 RepID=UPI0004AE3AE7|nr:nuclear transport factor 2 family protein [Cryptosporangium arvum]